ncbi:hypothetical protein OG21DRAFT_1525724 [Imleria badia]|nr:hypothetical protein OG21DRAFT_1525724 [Imleria badia]
MDYLSMLNVQIHIQRSLSFEELQSGAHFNSLSKSDLQLYRMYDQPVLIPSQDNCDASYSMHGSYPTNYACDNSLHVAYPSVCSYKSYALQDPLGAQSRTTWRLTTPSCVQHPIKQEPIEGVLTYPNPALPAIACQLYTLPELDKTGTETPISGRWRTPNGLPPLSPTKFHPPVFLVPTSVTVYI